VEELQE
jgi:hypothetical protein